MKRKSGFTLVELLVVIGIIALLISILLPALGKVRAQATMIKCSSNIRQIIIGIQMYANDNKQLMPRVMREGTKKAGVASASDYYGPHLTYFLNDGLGRCGLALLVNLPAPNPVSGNRASYVTSSKPAYLTKQVLFCPATIIDAFKSEIQLADEATWPDMTLAAGNGNSRVGYTYMPHWKYTNGVAGTDKLPRYSKITDMGKDKALVTDVFFDPTYLSHVDFKNKIVGRNVGYVDGHVVTVKSKVILAKALEWQKNGVLAATSDVASSWNDSPADGYDDLINIMETEAAGGNLYAKPTGAGSFCSAGQENFLRYRVDHTKIR